MIVLDTHAWLWLVDAPSRLSRPELSAIGCWELAMLVREGNRDIATWMATAPWYPADRIIYATARAHGAPIVTKERLLRDHDRGATIR